MRYVFLLLVCFASPGCKTTKHPAHENQKTNYLILHDAVRILEFDPIGHLYILDDSDRISKYDTSGRLLCYVVNNNLGEVHSIDVGNPFKTMVFYRNQQMILVYDRTLSEIQRIRLQDWGLRDITAACLSPDNSIWVFEGTNKVMMKLDDNGNTILTSDPFDILSPGSPRPDFIFDMDQFLLLKESQHPISVFDDFGKFLYNVDINTDDFFSVSGNNVITAQGNFIQRYEIAERKYSEPIILKMNIGHNRIYVLGSQYYSVDGMGVYKVTFE